jgi:hypothetical protein
MLYMFLFIAYLALTLLFCRWLFTGRLFGAWYAVRVIFGAFLDVLCQAWIDLSGLWKRKKKVHDLDETDDFYHRDA